LQPFGWTDDRVSQWLGGGINEGIPIEIEGISVKLAKIAVLNEK